MLNIKTNISLPYAGLLSIQLKTKDFNFYYFPLVFSCAVEYCDSQVKGLMGMNWKEKTVIRILLLVARLIAPAEWQKDVEQLATHISVNAKESQ